MAFPIRGWMVAVAAVLLTLPFWFILWFLGSLNDKLDGWHPTLRGYLLAWILATAAAVLAYELVYAMVRPAWRGWVYWPVVGLCGCALLVTFCLWWNRWAQEYRDFHGQPTDPPPHER